MSKTSIYKSRAILGGFAIFVLSFALSGIFISNGFRFIKWILGKEGWLMFALSIFIAVFFLALLLLPIRKFLLEHQEKLSRSGVSWSWLFISL